MFLVEMEIEANKKSVLEEMDLTIYLELRVCSFLSQLPHWCPVATEDQSSALRKCL